MITAAAAALRLGMSERRVRVLCAQRRIPGARYVGRVWLLPDPPLITPASRGPALRAPRKKPRQTR